MHNNRFLLPHKNQSNLNQTHNNVQCSNIFFPSTGTGLSFSSTLGECNNTEADVCRAFAIVAVACSGLALFFNAVMDESIHPKVTR